MKQNGLTAGEGTQSTFKSFKDEDYSRIIQAMAFDQRIEVAVNGFYKATNYNFPMALGSFENANKSNSRIVFTETPGCHCPIAS